MAASKYNSFVSSHIYRQGHILRLEYCVLGKLSPSLVDLLILENNLKAR